MSELDEQLRARLAGIDPVPPSSPVDPVTSPRASELLERTMLTNDTPTAADPTPPTSSSWWRRPAVLAAAASLVLVAGVGAATTLGGSDPKPAPAPTSVALVAAGGPSMSSCIQFSVDVLRDMPMAFSGSVTSVSEGVVTLDVDRWYAGGSADQVRVSSDTSGAPVSIEGAPTLEVGQRYLISANEGVVSSCGYSGPYSEELAQSFQEAFPG